MGKKFYNIPTRDVLIIGIAIMALVGVRKEDTATFRAHASFNNRKDADYTKTPTYNECKRLEEALRKGLPISTDYEIIIDALAYACQSIRIDPEEWESVLKIQKGIKKQ